MKIGDRVYFSGPCDLGYWPSRVEGIVELFMQNGRVRVRYPWGYHHLRMECLTVVQIQGVAA